jgi:hypothetical protein
VPGEHLLVADPVLHGRETAIGERVRRRRDRRVRVHRLRRDDAEVARGQLRGVGRRAWTTDDVSGARQAQAVAVDRVDVVARQVVCPDLDVVERCEVRRKERADRPAAYDTDSDSQDASFALINRYIVSCNGTGTPTLRASRTSAPVIVSTSVRRRAVTSSSIDG